MNHCPCGCGVWRALPYPPDTHALNCFCPECCAKRKGKP